MSSYRDYNYWLPQSLLMNIWCHNKVRALKWHWGWYFKFEYRYGGRHNKLKVFGWIY